MPDRSELIELLIDDWLNSIAEGGARVVEHLLREGFPGYSNMSETDLLQHATDAGLIDYGCSECGAPLDDGEGYDGRCGDCADQAEPDDEPDDASVSPWPGATFDEGSR